MQGRFWIVLAGPIVCSLLFAAVALRSAQSEPQHRAPETLRLTPVFAAAQDGPEFIASFENQTPQVINVLEALQASSIVLDGKTYKRQSVLFAGNASLRPGVSVPIIVDLGSYLPGFQRKGFSASLKRWRWQCPLTAGKHTLLLSLGGREYGPISFVWNADAPLLTQ